MTFKEIEDSLCDFFPLLRSEEAMQSHEVSRSLTQIVISIAHEYKISHEVALSIAKKQYLSEMFQVSFPLRAYANVAIENRLIGDIRNIAWKGFGRGELLFKLKASISELGNYYQIKNLSTAISLKPRPTHEKTGIYGNELLEEYFGGNVPGTLTRGKNKESSPSHFIAIEHARDKDVTPFFERLYGWPTSCCQVFSDLLRSGIDAYTFRQALGARIHREDAKIDSIKGYIFLTDAGFFHILSEDISPELCTSYGLKYSLHFKRGGDTQAVADGYTKVEYDPSQASKIIT